MGKLPVAKTKKDSTKIGSKVKRESLGKRNVIKSYQKRLLMLHRRISVFLDEKESWEAKNRELIENFNSQKKLVAELQKDVFNWQRLYHEAIISQNAYKVKHAETVQNMTSCLKDIKSVFPHLVGLSDTVCRTQIRLTNSLNALHTLENENHLPRIIGDGRQSGNDLSKKCAEKRMRHKVGPMVNGVLIQKPTIRLERVMLHQPQDQEPPNNDLPPERGNTHSNHLTPIAEENEQESNLHLEQISMRRRRKHRLGTGERWRMRKQQEQLEKERHMERENQRPLVTESSDSEDQLGPVIRLQRVNGLLLSPKLLEVDRGRASEGKGASSRSTDPESCRLRNGEDPKEGCSWMHINTSYSKKKSSEKRKPETSASSDLSDEESNSLNIASEKNMRSSLSDSLYKNKSFTMKRKVSSSSSTAETSHDVSDSSKVEPDSTNPTDDVVFASARASTSDSLSMNVSSDSTLNVNRSVAERERAGNSQTSSTSPGTSDQHQLSQVQKRSSSFCNNCIPNTSPDVQGKRIRKPKIHLYPGEEPENSVVSAILVPKVKKVKSAISSSSKVSHKQLSAGRKISGERSPRTSFESSPSSSGQRLSQGRPSGLSQKKKKVGRLNKSSWTNKSVEVSRTSGLQRLSGDQDESERRNSRRNRGPVSYKEPSCNVKMRRPK